MFGTALLALASWQDSTAGELAADPAAARAAQVGTIRARQVAAVSVGEPLDGVLLDVQWVSAAKAMALVARERTELVMYELRDTAWTAAHAAPVPASVAGIADVWIKVAPVAPGKLLVAYSGEAEGKPRTIVLSVSLSDGAVAEAAKWPFRISDFAGAGPGRFAAMLQVGDRELFLITDALGRSIAASDDWQITQSDIGTWDEPSSAVVCFDTDQVRLVGTDARVRANGYVEETSTTEIMAGALDGACYFGRQSTDGFWLHKLGESETSIVWSHPTARLGRKVFGPIYPREVDIRLEGTAVEAISAESWATYRGEELVATRDLTGLAVRDRDLDSARGELFASSDRGVVWLLQSRARGADASRFDATDLRQLGRASLDHGYLTGLGQACDGGFLCVRAALSDELPLIFWIGTDGSVREETVRPFSAYHDCIDGIEYVRRRGRLEDVHAQSPAYEVRPHSSYATVERYRPCVLATGEELRLRKRVEGRPHPHDQSPLGRWTIDQPDEKGDPKEEIAIRPDVTRADVAAFSISGRKVLIRFSDGEFFLCDVDKRRSVRVVFELPAPGSFSFRTDAALFDSGSSLMLWDGDAGKLRKLRLFADGE